MNNEPRIYGSKWDRARLVFLKAHPLCVMCQEQGRVTAATVVDHITPHKLKEALRSCDRDAIAKAQKLFWSQRNWQGLCKQHHDSTKQRIENPAWIFYDLVVTDRFGLGNRLTAANIDKWGLYQVAQYCDQMVPDGKGGSGTEPRYICNVYVQSRNEAYTVLRDFAAIFRGMTYWGGDQIVSLADMPRDIDYSYTRANVIDGKFAYSSSTTKTRYTTALVSYSDPANAYADAMEPVFEQALVARYGYNQLELTAIGCTRQSEANRKGRWGILTNNKDRIVSFSVGLDGNIPQPGYIIAVADELLSGKVTGGRISAVNGRVITLDRVADVVAGNRLIVNLPSGASQSRTVQSVNGKAITVTTAFGETPQTEAVWVVESDDLYAQQYRVVSISDNNDGTYTITGAYHDPDKYARIDTGAIIDQRPISVIPPGNQSPPENIVISSFSVVQQNISVETMRVSWDQAQNAIAYEAQWRRNDGNWVNVPRSSTTSFDVPGIYAGRYLVRVRAINAAEISSGWGYSEEKTLTGKVGNPPKPVGFTTTPINWGIRLNWGFPANTGDTLKTEIQYTPNSDFSDPLLLTDVPYPSSEYIQLGLKAGQEFWYRAQLVDRTGNESGYTDWVRGMANDNADDYLGDIADDFLTSADGDRLTGDIDTNIEGILQNALANHGTVEHQWAQFGEVRADIIVVKTTIAEVDQAMAEMATQVQAQFNDMTAVLEDKLTAVVDATGASAIYTLKTGVRINGIMYNAGMSIAVLAQAGQPVVTRVGFNANQFVLMSGSGDIGARAYNGSWSPWVTHYNTLNTTKASDGTLKAASPVARIVRSQEENQRKDIAEEGFIWCGCGTANVEAEGINISRLDVGIYELTGSSGLASEGWKLLSPMDPGGMGELGVVEAEQTENGELTIRLFERKYKLSDDGEIIKTKGALMDVPVNSWIDVRLDMPEDSLWKQRQSVLQKNNEKSGVENHQVADR